MKSILGYQQNIYVLSKFMYSGFLLKWSEKGDDVSLKHDLLFHEVSNPVLKFNEVVV